MKKNMPGYTMRGKHTHKKTTESTNENRKSIYVLLDTNQHQLNYKTIKIAFQLNCEVRENLL